MSCVQSCYVNIWICSHKTKAVLSHITLWVSDDFWLSRRFSANVILCLGDYTLWMQAVPPPFQRTLLVVHVSVMQNHCVLLIRNVKNICVQYTEGFFKAEMPLHSMGRYLSLCSNWCHSLHGTQSHLIAGLSAAEQVASSVAMQQCSRVFTMKLYILYRILTQSCQLSTNTISYCFLFKCSRVLPIVLTPHNQTTKTGTLLRIILHGFSVTLYISVTILMQCCQPTTTSGLFHDDCFPMSLILSRKMSGGAVLMRSPGLDTADVCCNHMSISTGY
jgi:hypothetical protein